MALSLKDAFVKTTAFLPLSYKIAIGGAFVSAAILAADAASGNKVSNAFDHFVDSMLYSTMGAIETGRERARTQPKETEPNAMADPFLNLV